MSDTYDNWMDRVAGGREAKPLAEGEKVQASSGEPFGVMEFLRLHRPKYVGEVGKKAGDYVFHFYALDPGKWLPDFATFEDKMGDAFLEVFRFSDRIESTFSPELNSWAVRARGFSTNPLSDELALRIFSILDDKLE